MENKKGTNLILPPEDANVITLPSATIWEDKSGLIIVLANGHQTLEYAKENQESIVKLARGKKKPILIDYTNILSISREARMYYGSEEHSVTVAACAIVINSLIGKMIANFHIGLNKATTPVKLFTDVTEAKKWLSRFINEDHQ